MGLISYLLLKSLNINNTCYLQAVKISLHYLLYKAHTVVWCHVVFKVYSNVHVQLMCWWTHMLSDPRLLQSSQKKWLSALLVRGRAEPVK